MLEHRADSSPSGKGESRNERRHGRTDTTCQLGYSGALPGQYSGSTGLKCVLDHASFYAFATVSP